MTDLQTLMACVTLLGAAALFWDAWKRSTSTIYAKQIEDVEKRIGERVAGYELLAIERWEKSSKELNQLREDNVAEFKAMKSEFDRFKARDAIEAYNQPRGNNARPY